MLDFRDDAWDGEDEGDYPEEVRLAQIDHATNWAKKGTMTAPKAEEAIREADNYAILDCLEVWKRYFGPIDCPVMVLAIFLLVYRAGRLRERREPQC